jgi:hypothetical protein
LRDHPFFQNMGLVLAMLVVAFYGSTASFKVQSSKADAALPVATEELLIFAGNCDCPDDTDAAGRRCGKRSAWSKPGGAQPICNGVRGS